MSEPIIYIDHSLVREGKLDELKTAMNELVALVEANEPRIITYNVFFTEDGSGTTVLHITPDSSALQHHMQVAGPAFPKFADFIKLLSIDLYGQPTRDLVEQLRGKAQMLGNGNVQVHKLHAGFARFGSRVQEAMKARLDGM